MLDPRVALNALRARIAAAERLSGRADGSVSLLVVSKRQSAEAIAAVAALGERRFGENYLQEALPKMSALADQGLEWHFIGAVQANKTAAIATHFDWVHTVAREKIAQRLNDQRPPAMPPLNVCLEVNISGEATKAGVPPAEVSALARVVGGLPRLRLRGLMALPAPASTLAAQRAPFRELRSIFAALQAEGPSLDTLSMGTTHDLEAAIAEGATIVRIGTALFGARR